MEGLSNLATTERKGEDFLEEETCVGRVEQVGGE